MHLDEFAVGVVHALLEKRRLRRTGTHHRICRAGKNRADAARAKNGRVGGECAHLHRFHIHRADASVHSGAVEDCGEKRPPFVLAHLPFSLEPAHLLVERVKYLLAGGGAGKCGAVIERATEAPVVEKSLSRAVEHHAHAVEQVDDRRSGLAHGFHGGLVG